MKKNSSIRLVVALETEAKPLNQEFNLSFFGNYHSFKVYKHIVEDHWLIISGIGNINVAAATMLLNQISNAKPYSFWLNIGIAGYRSGPRGTMYLVDKVTDECSGSAHFPRSPIFIKLKREELLTVVRPCDSLRSKKLVDMEGYSFYDTVRHIALKELIVLLKIVSDYPGNDYTTINKKMVYELIRMQLPTISEVIEQAKEISSDEAKRKTVPSVAYKILSIAHFSETQRHILFRLVRDWEFVYPDGRLLDEVIKMPCADQIIKKLTADLTCIRLEFN